MPWVLEIVYRVLHGNDLLRIFVTDLKLHVSREFLLKGHNEFDQIKGIGLKVVDERRRGDDIALVDAQLFDSDRSDQAQR